MNNKFKKIVASLILLGVLITGLLAISASIVGFSVASSQIEEMYVRNTIGSEVVKVYSEMGSGSGFFLKSGSDNVIITNRHVCEIKSANNTLKVKNDNTKEMEVKVLHESMIADICILEGDGGSHGLTISESDISIGQKAYIVGHPAGQPLTVSSSIYIQNRLLSITYGVPTDIGNGIIIIAPVNITSDSTQFHGYSRGGSSGSVITNTFGEVVSVLYAGMPSDNMVTFGVTRLQLIEVLVEFNAK